MNREDVKIAVLTKEERQNSSLVKEREEFKQGDVSIYFGSKKEGLNNVCLTCKKKSSCETFKEIKTMARKLKENAFNPFIPLKYDKEEYSSEEEAREKIYHNVFIAINCKHKEE